MFPWNYRARPKHTPDSHRGSSYVARQLGIDVRERFRARSAHVINDELQLMQVGPPWEERLPLQQLPACRLQLRL